MKFSNLKISKPDITRQQLIPIGWFLLISAVIGGLVVVSGIVPIKASSGHWGITEWFLNFSSSRSVFTHSIGIQAPSLDKPHLVTKGATYYATRCAQCHGSPAHDRDPMAMAMTPKPPHLEVEIPHWESEELFYIVKHGIKLTGMPAWPSLKRDDEVWAMVAFLEKYPEMTGDEYRELAALDIQISDLPDDLPGISPTTLENCFRCHGINGQGRGDGAFPRLAGQNETYLLNSLRAYKSGQRHSGMMQPIADNLQDEELKILANFFAKIKPDARRSKLPEDEVTTAAIERGRQIVRKGVPEKNVGSCMHCHGPKSTTQFTAYPRLAGMRANYLTSQLEAFKHNTRGGTDSAHLMNPVAENLTLEQIKDVAVYYQSLSNEK